MPLPSRKSTRAAVLLVLLTIVVLVALAPGPVAAKRASFDVLVFSKTVGYRHASIPDGITMIQRLGVEHGFQIYATDDASVFSDAGLARFRVVVFNNTNGRDGAILDPEQRAAFQRWIRAGGGFVGIHAASNTERDWPWYGQLVGTYFAGHAPLQLHDVKVADRSHPSTAHLPRRWAREDEPYVFTGDPRGKVHVLATVDESTYARDNRNTGNNASGQPDGSPGRNPDGNPDGHPGRNPDGADPETAPSGVRSGAAGNGRAVDEVEGGDHPVAWCHEFEGGRSWYTSAGHTKKTYQDDAFMRHVLGGIMWAAGAAPGDCGATVESNFEKVALDRETDDPLDLDIAPDGTVYFVERGGAVKAWSPAQRSTSQIAKLDVFLAHSHGMHGIALDPQFATNRWMYLYWTPKAGPDVIKLSRFTVAKGGGSLDLASEKVLLEVPSQRQYNGHEGGGIDFGPDGNLYLATGDNVEPCCLGYGATDEREGMRHDDAQGTAGNTNDLRGKILRIRPTAAGGYTIPQGNLFPPGTKDTRPEIYVMGLRQPYRLHVDPENGWVYWGEIGPDAREDDVARGPRGEDEINQARSPGNYGWPYCVGDNRPYNDYDAGTATAGPPYDCVDGPVNDSPNNTGMRRLPPAREAWIHYPYSDSRRWPVLGSGGRAAIAGPVYHSDDKRYARSPAAGTAKGFPEYYDDTLFIADWARSAIFEVKLDQSGQPLQINRFLPGTSFLRPIDFEFGPDGAMYLLEWGTNYGGSGRGSPNTDSGLYRIGYVPPRGRSPQVLAAANPRSGKLPLTVAFSSAGTFDPDAHALTYAWDFTSDGTIDSTSANSRHTYSKRGNYTARLTVTDATGRSSVANIPISVGNTAPVVTLRRPFDGQVFGFGEPIGFEVSITDAEDGKAAPAAARRCSRVRVQPALGHDAHNHPLEQYTGCSGRISSIGDHGHNDAQDNLFYVVDAKYTDMGAPQVAPLTAGDSAILQPRRKHAENWTTAGAVGSYDTKDGGRMVGQLGHNDWLSFDPYNLSGIGTATFRVASASKGGRIEMRVDGVKGPLVGSVDVAPTGGWYTFTTVTAPIRDPGGTHHLFLVFTGKPGDNSLFNLDWMELGRKPLTTHGRTPSGKQTPTPSGKPSRIPNTR
jgi:cytochrome c